MLAFRKVQALWLGIKLPTSASLLFLLTGKTKIKNEFSLEDFIIWISDLLVARTPSYTVLHHVAHACPANVPGGPGRWRGGEHRPHGAISYAPPCVHLVDRKLESKANVQWPGLVRIHNRQINPAPHTNIYHPTKRSWFTSDVKHDKSWQDPSPKQFFLWNLTRKHRCLAEANSSTLQATVYLVLANDAPSDTNFLL
jgi:hypothetical protein